MVDKKIIIETITELLDANVDKETIYATLRDIDVAEGDIETSYNEVINSKNKPITSASQETIKPKDTDNEVNVISATVKEAAKPAIEKQADINTKTDKLNYVDVDNISKSNASNKIEEELKDTTLEINDINNKHEVTSAKEEIAKSINILEPNSMFDKSEEDRILSKQISELETKIEDIKAELNGLTKIMKDILEENRNILNKL
jgi:uncharacterized membrane protein YdfJ with MMPL/SSD domain